MSDLILRQGDIDRFTKSLDRFISEAKVAVSVLIHRDGHLLATTGDTKLIDTTALSALVSASFSSMIAVANLVGEQEFTTQHLAGEVKSIYISLMDAYTFVVCVFDNGTPLEPIQQCAEEVKAPLSRALEILYHNEPEPFPDEDEEEQPAAEEAPPVEEEVVDAEEVARREQKGDGGKAVPRKLSYTGTGHSTMKAEEEKAQKERRKIREPDADEADFAALAAAISSRKERDVKPKAKQKSSSKKADDDDAIVVDGEKMSVVSLKDKKPKKGKKK